MVCTIKQIYIMDVHLKQFKYALNLKKKNEHHSTLFLSDS